MSRPISMFSLHNYPLLISAFCHLSHAIYHMFYDVKTSNILCQNIEHYSQCLVVSRPSSPSLLLPASSRSSQPPPAAPPSVCRSSAQPPVAARRGCASSPFWGGGRLLPELLIITVASGGAVRIFYQSSRLTYLLGWRGRRRWSRSSCRLHTAACAGRRYR